MEFTSRPEEMPAKLEKIHSIVDQEPEFVQNKENFTMMTNKLAATEELKKDEKILKHKITANKVKALNHATPPNDSKKFKKLLDSTVAAEPKPLLFQDRMDTSFMEHKQILPRDSGTMGEQKHMNLHHEAMPPKQPMKLREVVDKVMKLSHSYQNMKLDTSQLANKMETMEQIKHDVKKIPAEADQISASKFQGAMDEVAQFAGEAMQDTMDAANRNLNNFSHFAAPKISSFAEHVTNAINDKFPDDTRPESQKDPICSSTAKDDIRPGKAAAVEPNVHVHAD
jgi:hypothetical protein